MTLQSELKKELHYDPETGVFTRLVSKGNTKVGDVAGSVDTKGYLRVLFKGRREKLHRLAVLYMTGRMPIAQVDHEDGVKDNNRWSNLREMDNEGNASNRVRSNSNNSLGMLGVHRCKNKYRAAFKGKCLGLHDTPEEAQQAYETAKENYFASRL